MISYSHPYKKLTRKPMRCVQSLCIRMTGRRLGTWLVSLKIIIALKRSNVHEMDILLVLVGHCHEDQINCKNLLPFFLSNFHKQFLYNTLLIIH